MENGSSIVELPIQLVIFHIVLLVYQRISCASKIAQSLKWSSKLLPLQQNPGSVYHPIAYMVNTAIQDHRIQ